MNQMRIDPGIRVEMNMVACTEVIDNVRFDAMAAAIERITRRRAELGESVQDRT